MSDKQKPPERSVYADDYGLDQSINEGITLLATRKMLEGISVLVDGRAMTTCAWQSLRTLRAQHSVRIGLHWNLTENTSSSSTRLKPSGKNLFTSRRAIDTELKRQYEVFTSMMQERPDHLDSHHHIHQYPFFDEIFLSTVKDLRLEKIEFRNTSLPSEFGSLVLPRLSLPSRAKCHALGFLGQRFKTKLHRRGIKTNDSNWCCYSFSRSDDFDAQFDVYFRNRSAREGQRELFLCHPGSSSVHKDRMSMPRHHEFMRLMERPQATT
jgi:predicted glycoside hydrolase/deacetylase ChbG (UPF0249 family)